MPSQTQYYYKMNYNEDTVLYKLFLKINAFGLKYRGV